MNTIFCIDSLDGGPWLCFLELHKAIAEVKKMESHGNKVTLFEVNSTLKEIDFME